MSRKHIVIIIVTAALVAYATTKITKGANNVRNKGPQH